MQKVETAIWVFIILIICSCGRNTTQKLNNSSQVIRIDLLSKPVSTVENLSEIATEVKYIPLQTTENSLLGEFVLKIVFKGDRIYLQNSGLDGEIMCFDMSGKFLYKLDSKGRGPEEYTDLMDFDVNSDNNILTILSSMNRKLVTYRISDTGFTFQESVTIKDPVPWKISMVPKTDRMLLEINPWNRTAPTLSLLINSNGDTINYKPNYFRSRMGRISARATSTTLIYTIDNDNAVCFRELYSDTVFYVDTNDDSFKPRIIFDTHSTLATPEMVGHPENVRSNTTGIYGIYETSRFVFYNYSIESAMKFYCKLYDKKSKKDYNLDIGTYNVTVADIPSVVKKINFKDDLGGGPDFSQDIMVLNSHNSGGKLFSFVNALTLKNYVDGEDFKESRVGETKKGELKKLADSLKETDNPVLIMVTPKD